MHDYYKLYEKEKVYLKDKLDIQNIDYEFLLQLTCFSFFIRILLDQIQITLKITITDLSFKITIFSILISIISKCIVVPLAEEIIFRFGIYEIMNKKIGRIMAIILSSVFFSVIHSYLLYDTFILAILSIIWTYSYYKKQNLIYPIILHFLHNCYSIIGYIDFNNVYYIIFGILCLITCLLTLLYKKRSSI